MLIMQHTPACMLSSVNDYVAPGCIYMYITHMYLSIVTSSLNVTESIAFHLTMTDKNKGEAGHV